MRAFAKSIVETVRHPLLILDSGFCVQSANRPFYQLFRVKPEETVGRLIFELGDDGQWNIASLRELLQQVICNAPSPEPSFPGGEGSGAGAFEEFEVRYDFPQIGGKVLLLNARQVSRDEDPSPMILLAIEDVTENSQAQDNLSRLNSELEFRVLRRTAQLEAANKEMEAFCYSVSHDLRAPLRAIDGFSQELLQAYGEKLDDQGKHYLQRIRAGSQRMAELIDDLLQLSRLSRSEMRLQPVDLSALAEAIVADLQRREPARQVDVMIAPGLTANCDPGLLRVVLDNLFDNAWKFTSKHTRPTIEFGKIDNTGQTVFFVRDDGAGFDPAFAGKLFGAFQRLHKEREFPGTGIGLATVQRIIHRHGGRAWAEGQVEKGATVYFTLPERSDT